MKRLEERVEVIWFVSSTFQVFQSSSSLDFLSFNSFFSHWAEP